MVGCEKHGEVAVFKTVAVLHFGTVILLSCPTAERIYVCCMLHVRSCSFLIHRTKESFGPIGSPHTPFEGRKPHKNPIFLLPYLNIAGTAEKKKERKPDYMLATQGETSSRRRAQCQKCMPLTTNQTDEETESIDADEWVWECCLQFPKELEREASLALTS